MEKYLKYLMLLFVAALSVSFTACGDDDDEPDDDMSIESVVGHWYWTDGGAYHLYVDLYDNQSGELEYVRPSGYETKTSFSAFTYTMNNNTVVTNGVIVLGDGEVEPLNVNFTYKDGCLYPSNRYTGKVLKRRN